MISANVLNNRCCKTFLFQENDSSGMTQFSAGEGERTFLSTAKGRVPIMIGDWELICLRWLVTVSSTFQDLEFDGSSQPFYTG